MSSTCSFRIRRPERAATDVAGVLVRAPRFSDERAVALMWEARCTNTPPRLRAPSPATTPSNPTPAGPPSANTSD